MVVDHLHLQLHQQHIYGRAVWIPMASKFNSLSYTEGKIYSMAEIRSIENMLNLEVIVVLLYAIVLLFLAILNLCLSSSSAKSTTSFACRHCVVFRTVLLYISDIC